MSAVRAGSLADRAFDEAARGLDARDRAWAQELVYGTLRLRNRLDHHLAAHSSRRIDELDPDTLDILRLGAYQLLEMHSVPAYAAVSESVELAKARARRSAGFVNAVLQSLRRAPAASTFSTPEQDPVAYLTTWGSHPRWLVERWLRRFGHAAARRLVELNNTRPELYVRALGDDPAEAIGLLERANLEVEPVPLLARAYRITGGTAAAAVAAAPVIVQDPAAGLVVDYIGPVPDRIVDLAAAPGGKAVGLACDRPSAGRIIGAADISYSRLDRLRENVDRLGSCARSILPVVADGRKPPFREVDLVLLDAPCTGTGTFRRHPDARWRLEPDDLEVLGSLQAELLAAAASLVRPGGLLVYATCSLEPEENEVQVRKFLAEHPDFAIEAGSGIDAALVDADGMLRVLPHEHGFDGSFAARLRRSA